MKEIKTVSVIGLGNLGVAFGDHLSRNMPKEDLRFIADPGRIERYEKEKIYCNGKACDFQYVSPEEKGCPSDLIIITVKYQDLAEAVRAIRNQVGTDTVILSALNGITSEAVVAEAYGEDKVLPCVAQGMDGIKAGNRLDFDHMGMLCFGEKEAGVISERVKRVDDFFNKTGFPHEAETDMMKRMWGKLMMNVGVNQSAAVFRCNYGGLQEPGEPRDVMIAAMREVIPLSEKEGYPLTEEDLSYWLKVLGSLRPEGKPSMQQDAEAGKTTEVELFSGTVISLGQKYGIACPVNEFLYREITKDHLQIEIQMVDNSLKDNHNWKKLISMFALVGLKFEIHCWNEEREEIKAALKFGKEKLTDWEFGTIVEGVIDDKFIDMLHHTVKPSDTEIYNKMTPFFSIFFENGFSSEHYGTEFHILPAPIDDTEFTALLKQLQEHAVINEY